MFKKILFLFLSCYLVTNAKPLMQERTLIKGQLDNGFKYTIRKNAKPENKASIRLLVKVGSLEEDNDQRGVAHLVEHLAFNGTKHFKGNNIIKFLESIGVAFGSHLNASTGTLSTKYKLEVPLKDDNLEKAMLIFSDWAGGIEFTKEELDKERGVIQEEARTRNDLSKRLYEKSKDVIYGESKYKYRLPIGDMKVIKNISVKRVKDFYDDWYRPEFMHFVIVGDINVEKTKNLIEKYFKNLKNKSARKRASRAVPKVEKTRVLILKDKELTKSSVDINFFENYKPIKTENDIRETLIRRIIVKLFNTKAAEQLLKKNPFANALSMYSKGFASNLRTYSFSASYYGAKELEVLKELTNLMFYLEKFGFDEGDFKRIIKDYKKSSDQMTISLENKTSVSYANQITSYALYDDIFPDEKYSIKLLDKLLDTITLEELNKKYKEIFDIKSRLITYTISENVEVSKRRIKHILNDAKNHVRKKKKRINLPEKIDIGKLNPAKIVKENYNKEFDFYEFILENGIKIVYKFNNYKKNSISLIASSKGGYSLYDTKDFINAIYASSIIPSSGIDKYNALEVQKIYSDKIATVLPSIGRYSESITGTSITKDFDFLMQSIYLLTNKYKFDDNIFANTKQMTMASLKKANRLPFKKFSKELNKFYFKDNKRYAKVSIDDLEALNKESMLKIYKDRFSDFNNFTFIIVGDVKKEEVIKYSSLYLGNLPISKREESFNYDGFKPLEGNQKFIKYYNNENISKVSLSYSKETPYSLEESIRLSAFVDVLKRKLREYIREEKSGVYNISVKGAFDRIPYEKASLQISFSCNPKRKEELIKYVKEEIEDIKNNLVTDEYISAYVKKRVIALKEMKKKRSFWLAQLSKHYNYGDKINNIEDFENFYKSINSKIIKDTANKYLNTKNIFYTELNPKNLKI